MSVFLDISAALDSHLNSMTGLPDVAWENRTYTPTLGTTYLRPTNLQGDTVQASLGDSGQDMTVGIYQVDIFVEAGTGKGAAVDMADTIANHFKRGTTLTYNSRTLRVQNVSKGQANNDQNGWYMLSIEIQYKTYTQART